MFHVTCYLLWDVQQAESKANHSLSDTDNKNALYPTSTAIYRHGVKHNNGNMFQ
jgi:hypothetical protein